MYFNTNSVVFIHKQGMPDPSLGDHLEDFKDELSEGDFIEEFASSSLKNYRYLTSKGKQECKVHGIWLNGEGSKQLNYPVLHQNILDEFEQPLESSSNQNRKAVQHCSQCQRVQSGNHATDQKVPTGL